LQENLVQTAVDVQICHITSPVLSDEPVAIETLTVPSSRNHVLQNMIAKIDLDFFQDCDPTPHGKFSYQKATQKITGKSAKIAKSLLNRIFNGRALQMSVEYFRYPGRTGPKSPIGTPLEILRYAALLPGPEGDAIRKAQTDPTMGQRL
jgi:hypothetical protein